MAPLTLLPGVTMRNSNDVRTLGLASFYYVITYVAWHAHETWETWQLVPLWAVVTFFSFVGATLVHNTMHCQVFKQYWPNKLFQIMLTLTYGHPVSSYVPGHNLSHHKFTQAKADIMRTSKMRYRWHFLNLLLFQPTVAGSVMAGDFRYVRLQVAMGSGFATQVLREFAVLIVSQGYLLWLDPWKYFLYLYLPHLVAQWGIVTINVPQHDGCESPPIGETTPNSARNFTGAFLNWFTCNNGYHTIHHAHPTMHWSEYQDAHAREIAPHAHPNLTQESLLAYAFETFVYPAKRLTYDGKPVKLPPAGKDEDWMQYPDGIKPEDLDLTPMKVARYVGDTLLLAGVKVLDPLYSPVMNLI